MSTLVFLDTETASTAPGRRIWEIGLRRRRAPGEKTEVLTLQITDIDLTHASVSSLKVGRFYERHRDYRTDYIEPASNNTRYVTEAEAARIVEEWTRDALLVALVPSFDAEALADMLRRHQLVPAWHYYLFDIANIATGWLAGRGASGSLAPVLGESDPDMPLWQLKAQRLSAACGVEPPGKDEEHTAQGDAAWVERWWDRIFGDIVERDREVITLCGSMRFHAQMMRVGAEESLAGHIVLPPFVVVDPADQNRQHKLDLDELHRAKIDRSHRIIVVSDETGYIGPSTRAEIDYAIARGKYRPDKDFRVVGRTVAVSEETPRSATAVSAEITVDAPGRT